MFVKSFFVDTDLIIDLIRGLPEAKVFFKSIEMGEFAVAFSTITEVELFAGKSAANTEEQTLLDRLFSMMSRVEVNKEVARKAGEFIRETGRSIPDCIIAASAIVERSPVVATRNIDDFNKFKEIKIFSPY